MSMYPGHRGMPGVPPNGAARLNELLDQIRSEFESQMRTGETYEHQSTISRLLPLVYLFS
jgi:general transcriptional corepressor TUP1